MSDVAEAALVLVLLLGLAAVSVTVGVVLIRLLARATSGGPASRSTPPLPARDEDDEEIAARYHS